MKNNIKAEIVAHSKRAGTGEEIDIFSNKPPDKNYYIYKTTNLINGKFYVGKSSMKNNSIDYWYLGSGVLLKKAIEKYGRDSFKKEIIEWCSSFEESNEREKYWISTLNALNLDIAYNIATGGDGGYLGEEVNRRISEALKGRKHTEEFKQHISKLNKGKKLSKEHIEALRKANLGIKRSDEYKQKSRERMLKKYEDGFQNPHKVEIYKYDKQTGEYIGSYLSCTEASIDTGISRKAIQNACFGRNKNDGFIWSRAKFKNYYNRFSVIKAEIICHSKRASTGEEIITYKLTYPRCIHSELMTYHMMSVNSASSRAIPVDKLISVIEETPFYPCYFQLQHKGMQGNSYADYSIEQKAFKIWNESLYNQVKIAKELSKDVTKQLVNRLLEPYQYHCCLMTGTRESFEHLFKQRCPIYNVEGLKFASKKEAIELYPHLKNMTDLEWLQCNSGQAEIHFMDLAEKMYDALNESTPDILKEDEWHIPFKKDILSKNDMISLENIIKMSVCLTAKVSYTKIGDENTITIEKAREMYDRLKDSGHWSCFGHIAKCMTNEDYRSWYKGFISTVEYINKDNELSTALNTHELSKAQGYNKNLKGFVSLRQYVEDGVELKEI
jgi:group I intron endonuclease|nr:MAG TPA: intron associated endonuclease [Caudoviricetes sp.]